MKWDRTQFPSRRRREYDPLDTGIPTDEPLGSERIRCVWVPVINRLVAGYREQFTDMDYPPRIADEYIPCPDTGDPQQFAARIMGDSMTPKYQDGDIVVFTPNTPPQTGQACFVRFADTDETTFKAFYADADADADPDGKIRLQPLNPAYPAQHVDPETIAAVYPAAYRITRLDGR